MTLLPPMSDDTIKLNPQLAGELKPVSPSKYGNVRTQAKGMTFQSGREAAGVAELIMLEEQHLIFGLRLQVKFKLGKHDTYIADATYAELDEKCGQLIFHIVDFKGYRTRDYLRKRKLFLEYYGQEIEEK